MNILLEIQNLFDHQSWYDYAWPQEEIFQSTRSDKKCEVKWWRDKNFSLKIPQIHTLPDSTGNQFSSVSVIVNLVFISKFGIETPDTCGYVAGEV